MLLVSQEYSSRLLKAGRLLSGKDYSQALLEANRVISFFRQIAEDELRKQLLLQACSLRGWIYFKLCKYDDAGNDLASCLKLNPIHLSSLRRMMHLDLKRQQVEHAISCCRRLLAVSPEEITNEELFEDLEEAIDLVPSQTERSRLRSVLQQLQTGEEEVSGFQSLRAIDVQTKKSARKLVDFASDEVVQFQKTANQQKKIPLPVLDETAFKNQCLELEQFFREVELDSECSLVVKSPSLTRSILTNPHQGGKVLAKSAFSMRKFDVTKIKDIDGKRRTGKSSFACLNEPMQPSIYRPRGQTIRSAMKATSSFFDQSSSLAGSGDLKLTQPRLNIEGKLKAKPKSEVAARESDFVETWVNPLEDYLEAGRSVQQSSSSCLKEKASKSILKSKNSPSHSKKSVSIRQYSDCQK